MQSVARTYGFSACLRRIASSIQSFAHGLAERCRAAVRLAGLPLLLTRAPLRLWQRAVQRQDDSPARLKATLRQRMPRRVTQTKQGSTRISRTMTRGAALARISASRRGANLSSWTAVRIKRRQRQPLHRRACRYVRAICKKSVALLRDVVQKAKTSLTESRRWLLSSGDKEQQGLRRPDKVTRRPLRWQLLSRALTVAVYTFGLECGMVLALPTWMRVVSAYCAAAAVPMLLPTAHGANCRVATTIAATCLAGARVSLTSASVVSAVLFLCPAWILWWTKDRVDDSVTPILKKVLKWMDDHNNVLPTGYATPPPEKKGGE